ncbi:hypothetical protein N4T77_01490 [Clostridium sp. CX1]|uniref:WD40/YVTN/BNR-like repeat-containing protein n=1 Tax=Clostridium sp. CX1 TaxID=2978346 RepID=UPI0021BED3CA|nr:sialidase family protein [Clostridium sp. CX1]MCT8975263.1 hypothetical protein [Clostridium sp. CX1]
MFENSNREPKKKLYRVGAVFCTVIVILAACYFGYYKYQQSKVKFQSPEGFSVKVNTKDLTVVGAKWLEAYTEQYRGKYVPRNQRLIEYSVDGIEIKETNVIQVDFSIVTKKLDERSAYNWNGSIEKNRVKSQWVLRFKEELNSDGTFTYTVTKLQRPAGYDLEKYQSSGEKERDEYKHKYEAEIPYENQQYTYKIENKMVYVSYNKGSSWKEVPVPLETLVSVGDGRPYYNKLQEKSYVITPGKTAFVYGGTRDHPLMMIHSEDGGITWKTSEISKSLDSTRVKFCSFPTATVGYVIATSGRTMSQEGQMIYKTTNGGDTWKEVGDGPSTWLLQSAGFVDENLGFISYPKVDGAATNFYRTEDGGKTFESVILPVHREKWMDVTLEPFIQPETPYVESGKLFLLVGQGEQGDFKGGTVMAKYKSEDRGKTWSFVELVEPPSKETG